MPAQRLASSARRAARSARDAARSAGAGLRRRAGRDGAEPENPLDYYVAGRPTPQHIVDLFDGDWSSGFPPEAGVVSRPGIMPLSSDPRIDWALETLGGAEGRTIVELGPLEAMHTYMLERAGAASIDAIEANGRAFMRCLCTKEILGLTAARFHLGDAVAFLELDDRVDRYDLGVACGVLYHMEDPVGLLDRLGRRCDRLFLWTQYYDEEAVRVNVGDPERFGPIETAAVDGFEYQFVEQRYRKQLDWRGFCGGSAPGSRWLTRDSLEAAIRRAGYTRLTFGFDEPDGPNGPALAVCATR